MKKFLPFILIASIVLFFSVINMGNRVSEKMENLEFVTYVADTEDIVFNWNGESSIDEVVYKYKSEGKEVLFSTNGGMFKPDYSPVGMYIQDFKELFPLDTFTSRPGNFYMEPNGLFFINSHNATIISRDEYKSQLDNKINKSTIEFATQSGPMLLSQGEINPLFSPTSENLKIRNAVGILPSKKVLFVQSKHPVSFYRIAEFFKEKKCQNALYLDGVISQSYHPSTEWEQKEGRLGVIISVLK